MAHTLFRRAVVDLFRCHWGIEKALVICTTEGTEIALNEGNIISVTGLLVIYLFIVCWDSCIVKWSPNMLL